MIPALVGRPVSDIERRLLTLHHRHGGLGIYNRFSKSDREYLASSCVTAELANLICLQVMDLTKLDIEKVKKAKIDINT